jgi:predicted nucleic acid-binding protein
VPAWKPSQRRATSSIVPLNLQRDLAHHHGMWHRTPIPDLLIAETALHHHLGVVHVDGDYDRIAEVRPLTVRRLR